MKEVRPDNLRAFHYRIIKEPTRIILPNNLYINSLFEGAKILAPVEVVAPKAFEAKSLFDDAELQAPVKLKSPYAGLFRERNLFNPDFEGSTFDALGETAKNVYNLYYSSEARERFTNLSNRVNKTLEKLRQRDIYLRWIEDGDFSLEVAFYNIKTDRKYTPQTETEKLILELMDVYTNGHSDGGSGVYFSFSYKRGMKYVEKMSANLKPDLVDHIIGRGSYGLNTKGDLKALVDLYDFIQGKRTTVSSFSDKTLLVKSALTKTKNPPIATALHRAAKSNFAQVLRKVICK